MATEETKPVEREAFNKFLASRKMGHSDVLIVLIEDVWQVSADAALERAAQVTRCYKCEAEIRALKGRE